MQNGKIPHGGVATDPLVDLLKTSFPYVLHVGSPAGCTPSLLPFFLTAYPGFQASTLSFNRGRDFSKKAGPFKESTSPGVQELSTQVSDLVVLFGSRHRFVVRQAGSKALEHKPFGLLPGVSNTAERPVHLASIEKIDRKIIWGKVPIPKNEDLAVSQHSDKTEELKTELSVKFGSSFTVRAVAIHIEDV
eukprot:5334857-Amphidinium_carterae.2